MCAKVGASSRPQSFTSSILMLPMKPGRDEIDWGRSFLARRQVGIRRGIVFDDADPDLAVSDRSRV
jgi:hypothetical protein